MSYILDALKKAEQERRQGSVPTLQTAILEPEPAHRPPYLAYALAGLGLAAAGLALGLAQPWRTRPQTVAIATPVSQPLPAATAPPASITQAAPAQAAIAPNATQAHAAPVLPPAAQAAMPAPKASTPTVSATPLPAPAQPLPISAPLKPASPTSVTTPAAVTATQVFDSLPTLDALPPDVRQGIPSLNVLMHAYSSQPKERLAMINNKPLHEGDYLTPELKLEQIVPDGMVFSYRGTRFRTGVK